ncbi:MAG: YggS family pyridoxal phosphate-dependent enzyme [Gemmatimonadales bacterium]|jgi:pyridoxal phosphate enzyme (YggS family)
MYLERLRRVLPEVRGRIARARERVGRLDDDSVTLVAVTKGHPVEALYAAREAGLNAIGESRVQEGLAKSAVAGDLDLEWHLVGHLQRNKVRDALGLFSLIHSVDSLRLARALASAAEKQDRAVAVLVQVNASGEAAKFGVPAAEVLHFVREVSALEHLRVLGLMTMAPFTEDEFVLRKTFRVTRELYERCCDSVEKFQGRHISMGMTNDYEIAVEEGSSMVRLGTALFGERGK